MRVYACTRCNGAMEAAAELEEWTCAGCSTPEAPEQNGELIDMLSWLKASWAQDALIAVSPARLSAGRPRPGRRRPGRQRLVSRDGGIVWTLEE